ncbi:hypothetical protein D3C81_1632750 [compost metagenome]
MAGAHQLLQITSVFLFLAESVVIVYRRGRVNSIQHGLMKHPEILGVQGGAAVAQVIEIVADGLKRHDQRNKHMPGIHMGRRIDGAADAVKLLVPHAGQRLLPQLRIRHTLRLLPPLRQLSFNLGQHIAVYPPHHGEGALRINKCIIG